MPKPIFTFAKAQISAFLGGMLDYAVMIACTELLHIHYTISIIISGTIGAVLNFSLNRYWSFKGQNSNEAPVGSQLVKFCLMVAGSVLLKAFGTYLLTSSLKLDYRISRLIIDVIVSLGFNYVLQNYWVFKKMA
ncbi:GtrA family protein [Mucilaginibacter sp.]|uniref:GtrA family protein n=1 Tax=Mucilaginibacter sp. TaxID=1882438 RepID=UPI003AFF81DA